MLFGLTKEYSQTTISEVFGLFETLVDRIRAYIDRRKI